MTKSEIPIKDRVVMGANAFGKMAYIDLFYAVVLPAFNLLK